MVDGVGPAAGLAGLGLRAGGFLRVLFARKVLEVLVGDHREVPFAVETGSWRTSPWEVADRTWSPTSSIIGAAWDFLEEKIGKNAGRGGIAPRLTVARPFAPKGTRQGWGPGRVAPSGRSADRTDDSLTRRPSALP